MSDFLDLIAEAAAASGTAGADLHEQVARVKKSRVFDEKVSFAAGLLPAYLRPGGVNPIDALHGVASEGLHALSEAECIERFDRARAGFEFLFQRLRVEKKQAEEFVKGMKALTARRERRGETREVEAPPKTG
jgi:hypothetical protein